MATQALLATVTAGVGVANAPIATQRVAANGFIVQVHPSNTDVVWFGDSTVNSTTAKGIRLEIPVANSILPMISVGETTAPNGFNLKDYCVSSPSSGQKVNIFYVTL